MALNRWSPYEFKNGQTACNRVIVPPMASQTADEKGLVTEQTLDHYRRLTMAGTGIVFVEYSFIHPTGRGEANQLAVDSDETIPGLTKLAKLIKDSGALSGLQIVHVGGKTSSDLIGSVPMAPSAVPVPVKGWEPDMPVAMAQEQILDWETWFVDAAKRAQLAGFDIVELHAAHGYGLNQWLSPVTNHRQDENGGSIQGRSRLLLRIAARIKSELPGLLLAVRLPAQDHLPGGLTTSDMAWVVRELEKIGADLIDVSSGIGGWRRPDGRNGEGYLVADAALLKSHLSFTPVIGVGGIETGHYIDHALQSRQLDFAAVGRAILHDPQAWSRTNLTFPTLRSYRLVAALE